MIRFTGPRFLCISVLLCFLLCIGSGCRMVNGTASTHDVIDQLTGTPKADRLSMPTDIKLPGFRKAKASSGNLGLYATTPYDENRIPVVMVHGLVSDPFTWNQMLAQLREDPRIDSKFQFWIFSYSTGNSILKSGSDLRLSLDDAMHQLDPKRQNPKLTSAVLIGHSMGGLLSKLQVTYSDDKLWDKVVGKPIDQLELDSGAEKVIRQQLYFEPQPMVSRVIYIGVPHQGSRWSDSMIGRLGGRFIGFPESIGNGFQNPLTNKRGVEPIDSVTGVRTTVDQISSRSATLKAIAELRTATQVEVHSIIGTAERLPDGSPGDGLVSVESARIENTNSELYVSARHADLTRTPESIMEVKRILIEHLAKQPPEWSVMADH